MENIALAFSGGGFRAACFSLGALSYLNHIKYKKDLEADWEKFCKTPYMMISSPISS